MTVQRAADGGRIIIRDIARDALGITDADIQRRVDQIERDRIDAWLDIASERTGVHKANIVTALAMRADAATADVTRDMIIETAAALARQANPATPAQYHRPPPRADAARGGIMTDQAFRAHLASKHTVLHADRADAAVAAPAPRPAARRADGTMTDNDFRAQLASKLRADGSDDE